MTIADFQEHFERTTPPGTAWKHDNIGLLVGSPDTEITSVLVALDVTMETAKEAVRRRANLIVAHHPVIFRPLAAVTTTTRTGALVTFLIEQKIAVFAAHTNFDSVRHGVSFALAARLGLTGATVLAPLRESLTKVAVFVPHAHAEQVAQAMHHAGGGTFTTYEECSFRTEGLGTFKAMRDARPFIGSVGTVERTPEIRLEMLAERWKVPGIVAAMKRTHPYEEPAYDVYTLENANTEYGLGAVGDLPAPMEAKKFLAVVRRELGAEGLRYAGDARAMITRVAVCGGAGGDLISDAVQHRADAFVTADLKYHAMQDAAASLLVVDAGHFETEWCAIPTLTGLIRQIGTDAGMKLKIVVSHYTTNPIHFC